MKSRSFTWMSRRSNCRKIPTIPERRHSAAANSRQNRSISNSEFGPLRPGFGNLSQAIANGTGATWPFAKLSASQETLRLQTPFGNYDWEKADPRLIIQKTGLSGQWKIGAENAAMTRSIVFSTFPWKIKTVERKLKELGYEVRPRTRAPHSSAP
jgi:hypothetical protein